MSDPGWLWWYVSTPRWTCAVETTAAKPFVIATTPPLLRRFLGQPLRNLHRWARPDGFIRIA
jgi:hypothetical protein